MHSTSTGGGIHHLRENDDLQAKIANLTRKLEDIELKKVNEVTSVPQIPSVPMGPRVEEPYIICDDPTHSTINFPNLPQVKGVIQIEQANSLNYQRKLFNSPYSETYNPGWGKHPNFSWRNEGGPHNLPNNQGPHFQNQVFQTKPFRFRIKFLKDFLCTLTKASIRQIKGIQTHNLISLHIREVLRLL